MNPNKNEKVRKRKKNKLGNKVPSSIENGSSENTSVVS
jgi:hypothetical protein